MLRVASLLICSEDGWVDIWVNGEPPREWPYNKVKKYQSVVIYCLDENQTVYLARPEYTFPSFYSKMLAWITSALLPVDVSFSKADGMTLDSFRKLLISALTKNSERLTQFESHDEISEQLSSISSYRQALNLYQKLGWFSTY